MSAPAPVAALMDAIVGVLNGDVAQERLGPVDAVRLYQGTQPLAEKTVRSIQISPFDWKPIGRCGTLRLEQHVLNLTLCRKDLNPANAAIDDDQQQGDSLRVLLQDLDTPAGRVIDVLGPLTFDRPAIAKAGLLVIPLALDCEILIQAEGEPAPTGEPGRLGIARAAVWDAINHWPALEDVFARRYQSDLDLAELQLRDPAAHELPAIALYWGGIQPEWRNHKTQEWPLTLRLSVWVPGHQHSLAENLCEEVFKAIYQSADPDTPTVEYIRQATGYPPRRVGSMTIETVVLGRAQQLQAIRADVAFTLRSNIDPFGEE